MAITPPSQPCQHQPYPCTRITVPPYAVWDARLDPPRLTTAVRIGCRCPCEGCAPLIAARHAVDGVPGYPLGVVWNPELGPAEQEMFLALPRRADAPA